MEERRRYRPWREIRDQGKTPEEVAALERELDRELRDLEQDHPCEDNEPEPEQDSR